MEHNTDRILWTVLVLAIGVALYVGFRPAANGLLGQTNEKILTVVGGVNDHTRNSSNSNPAAGANLLTGTSSDLQTAPDSSCDTWGGCLHIFNSNELNNLTGNQVTVRAFIHNPTTHTVNLMMWTDGGGYNIGTGVPAGTDGYSTIPAYNITASDSWGYIAIRAYADNAAISGVQYKELKLEKGGVATPYTP